MNNHLSLLCLFVFFTITVAREAIINGDIAKPYEFPYHVSLQIRNEDVCSGAIIDDQFVITAAHCIIKIDGHFKDEPFTVLAGTNNLRQSDSAAVRVRVKKLFVPTEFDYKSMNSIGDVAVLELYRPLGLSRDHRQLKHVKLPTNQHEHYVDEMARVSGYGWNWIEVVNQTHENGGNTDLHLRSAEAQVLNISSCKKGYPRRKFTDKHICARIKQRHDKSRGVCTGDSGGPLVSNGILVGVLSISPLGCDETKYGAIYSNVALYLTFIHNAMRNHSNKYTRVFVRPMLL